MPASDKLNCILIIIDTLRADHLSCYGYFRKTSPNIDELAETGVMFKDFHSSGIPTGPGFTSIFTGLFPIHHKFYITPWNLPNLIDFDDEIPTLPEIIIDNAPYYVTAAFDNLMNFASHMDQFVRGFEYYINVTKSSRPIAHHVIGERINERLIPWLQHHKDEKFFLFVHYWDPHTPYNQPEDYRNIFKHEPGNLSDLKVERAPAGYQYVPGWGRVGELWEPAPNSNVTIDLYDGEIRYVDTLVGELINELKKLKIDDNTVVIITSDHGEQLGQHGIYDHRMLHEAVTHVPLIIWGPGNVPEGKIINGYAQHVDIAPTILDFLGIDYDEEMFDGQSLVKSMESGYVDRAVVFMEGHEYRGLIKDRWKYMLNYFKGTEELYNLAEDPMEVVNRVTNEPSLAQEMRETLLNWVSENLEDEVDPLWIQMSKWAAEWNRRLGKLMPDLAPRPTLIEGVDIPIPPDTESIPSRKLGAKRNRRS